jgi:hypothetical protein
VSGDTANEAALVRMGQYMFGWVINADRAHDDQVPSIFSNLNRDHRVYSLAKCRPLLFAVVHCMDRLKESCLRPDQRQECSRYTSIIVYTGRVGPDTGRQSGIVVEERPPLDI